MRFNTFVVVASTSAAISIAAALPTYAALRSESFVVPAGQEKYVGDVPIFGEACFKVVSKVSNAPARAHFRGLINGKPIDLDYHFGGRCLKFVRDGGVGLYRVYVIAEGGEDLVVTRTVNEKNHDWQPMKPNFQPST